MPITSPSPRGGAAAAMSRLPNVCLVLITPDSSEIRWVSAAPEPGARLHSRFGRTWIVVDDVFQSGPMTYTVFASMAPEAVSFGA